MLSYFNGKYLDKDEIHISPDDRGFLFADGLYEVARSYSGKLFRMKDHIERLNYGAREIRLPVTDFGYLEEVAEALIRRNNLVEGDALVYFQVTRGAHPRLHKFPPPETPGVRRRRMGPRPGCRCTWWCRWTRPPRFLPR